MNNLSALKGMCNAICSTFYPDLPAMQMMLFNSGIAAFDEATPKDHEILKAAIKLVQGYVESSRSEGGVSTSIDREKVNSNIRLWCREYGLDADDYLSSQSSIENGSNRW